MNVFCIRYLKDTALGIIEDEDLTTEPVIIAHDSKKEAHLAIMDMDRVERISGKIRKLLLKLTPEVVSTAEDFADEATYQYRKLRKQVRRNPGVTIGIAAAAIGTFLLIRHALRDDD